jgi:hypothetical protein
MKIDCLDVVNLCICVINDCSIGVPILDEVSELVTDFKSFLVNYVRCSANNSTHLCTRLFCIINSWFDDSRAFLVNSLHADCT